AQNSSTMGLILQLLCFLLLLRSCPCAVITGACERDPQCGRGTCCALSLWLRGLRVPFFGKRQHHTCPCLPNLLCSRFLDSRFRCSSHF
ncbi:Prokineticin-1, partial [Manacus vitellinus]